MRIRFDHQQAARDCDGRASELRLAGRPRPAIAGQSIILAVMVMFLLMFLGGVFIALLRRNLTVSEHHGQALTAQQLSEAGIDYANTQLTNSVDGADWRPVPFSPPQVSLRPGCGVVEAPQALDAHDP